MSIWVKIAEQVTALGSDIVAGLRRIAGKSDAGPADPERSVGFTIGMIALGAKMAKVDGAVTEREVKAFREVFHIPPDELPNVAYVFNLAKQDVAGYELYAQEVSRKSPISGILLKFSACRSVSAASGPAMSSPPRTILMSCWASILASTTRSSGACFARSFGNITPIATSPPACRRS